MLEKNHKIYRLYEGDVSLENVYNCFFEIESNILYVVDARERFVGIITSGEFMRFFSGGGQNSLIKMQCSTILRKDEAKVFQEAAALFEKYHITTAIPVLDEEGKVCERQI